MSGNKCGEWSFTSNTQCEREWPCGVHFTSGTVQVDSCWMICPYCGARFLGSDEFEEGHHERSVECFHCKGVFTARADYSVDYVTEPKDSTR